MLKKVKLYGKLGERFGKEWELDINNVREAVRAISANNPEFKKEFTTSHERGIGYHVIVGDEYLKDENQCLYPTGRKEIKIVPAVIGSKSKGLGMILLGALIIGMVLFNPVSILQSGAALAEGGTYLAATGGVYTSGQMMALKFAGSLILSGIGAMLAPTPKPIERKEEPENYAFNGPVNTTSQGVAVPICYGKLLVGGAVISAGIQAEDYNPEDS